MKKFFNASGIMLLSNIIGIGIVAQAESSDWNQNDRSEYWNRPMSFQDSTDSQTNSPYGTTQTDDATISRQAQGIIEKGDFRNVNIQVRNGRIILTGQIQTDQQKRTLEMKLKRIDGVQTVDNRLAVMSNQSADSTNYERNPYGSTTNSYNRNMYGNTNTDTSDYSRRTFGSNNTDQDIQRPNTPEKDQEIKNEVLNTLRGGFFTTGYPNVRAEVHNGNVILTGTVDTENNIQDIETKVNKIEGVKNITNQIRLAQK